MATTNELQGIEQSANNSGEQWLSYALGFLTNYLKENKTMFCDDLWDSGLEEPISPRALGQVIRTASRTGLISEYTTSLGIVAKQSKRSNNQLKRIWKSNIYQNNLEIS